MARLGVNVDSIAALREVNGVVDSDPVTAAIYAEVGSADGIVCSLKEELKPITERDAQILKKVVKTHFNIQVLPVEAMINQVLTISPDMVTFMPGEKPGSTPGGGLDVLGQGTKLAKLIEDIRAHDIVVSLFVEPMIHQIKAAAKAGADYIELHLGKYSNAEDLNERADQLENIGSVALAASKLGLGVAASQGLDYSNVSAIREIASIEEINVGEAIVGRALWIGMEAAVRDMVALVH
jgi:pyridoxine 5-phosphate synthase